MSKKLLFVLFGFSLFNIMYSAQLPKELAYGYCLRTNGKGWQLPGEPIHWRQEDTVRCVSESGGRLFISLFDGHNGAEISTFLKNNLYEYFNGTYFQPQPMTVRERLEFAFKMADDKTPSGYKGDVDYDVQGSMAVVGILEPIRGAYQFTVAWVGDSRAVVADTQNNDGVLFETIDHTPNNEKELERIVKAGGEQNITTNSEGKKIVNGLEGSRAFGDKGIREKLIIPEPDIEQMTLISQENPFLIFASDGIWNKVSSQDAIKIVTDAMKKSATELRSEYPDKPKIAWGKFKGQEDPTDEGGNNYLKLVARALAYEAIKRGSEDNISVIVVDLEGKAIALQRDLPEPVQQPIPAQAKPQSWWSSQSTVKKYLLGLSATLGLTALGSYLYYKFYEKK